jgi:hypothetical protein
MVVKTMEERRREFHEDIRAGQIPYRRRRARSKQANDAKHFVAWQERKRLFHEAHHDVLDSLGETDALTESASLQVVRGDVLRDPKLRPLYLHPSLR